MRSLFFLFLTLLFTLIFTSCRDDIEEFTVSTTSNVPPAISVNATITGLVIIDVGRPVNGAVVSIPGLGSTTTNDDGRFSFPPSEVDANGTLIFVDYGADFGPDVRRIMPNANSVMYEVIEIPNYFSVFLNGATGGTGVTDDGMTITVAPGSVRQLNGSTYNGDFSVSFSYDNPDTQNDMLNSAGNLRGFKDGEEVELESYGMVDLRITSNDGEELTFDPENPAEITFPLTEAAAAGAEETIDFWMLEESQWNYEGFATIGNAAYIARITTSGTYNCDVPHTSTRFCGRLVDANGIPLPFEVFSIRVVDGYSVNTARTDCLGRFCAGGPRDTEVELVVTDPCDDSERIFPLEIATGPNVDVGDIMIDLNYNNFATTLVNCPDGSDIDHQNIGIWIDGLVTNGRFIPVMEDLSAIVSLADCGNQDETMIQAVSFDGTQSSRIERRSISDDSPLILDVCSQLDADEILDLSIDGEAVILTQLSHFVTRLDDGTLQYRFRAVGELDGYKLILTFQLPSPDEGVYTGDGLRVYIGLYEGSGPFNPNFSYSDLDENYVITIDERIENTGGTTLEGTFTYAAHYRDMIQTLETDIPVTATFRLNL